MNKRSILGLAFAAIMALIAGVAYAQPDALAATWHAVTSHADIGAAAMLAWGPLVRGLEQQHATAVDAMKAVVAKAENENREFTAEEKATYDQHKASAESLKGRIARAQETELAEAGISRSGPAPSPAAPGSGIVLPSASRIVVEDNAAKDPKRGFMTLGEFARSVVGAAAAARTGHAMDARLAPLWGGAPLAAAPTTYGNEGAGADGGFLIPPGFSSEVFTLSLQEDSYLTMCDDVKVEGNGMSFPRDETTPWGTDGIRAYWQGEAVAGTQTKPALGADSLRLKKLLALTPITDEMLSDASALASYLPGKMADSIRWKTNEAILWGTGGGTPLGAFIGAASIVQAKDSGQAANTLTALNCANMMSRLLPASFPRAVWLVNNDVLPVLFTLTLGNYPIYMAPGSPQSPIGQAPYGMLLGRPIMVTQHAKSLSSQGDLCLVDFKGYRTITKTEGMQTATSMHLFFDADAMAFRTTFRVDGMPKASKPVSPANGSNTLSWFIQLAAR